jgi:hypothetical protein
MASTTHVHHVFVEVIRMESAVVVVDVAAVERAEPVVAPRCGRFSTGMERLPETSGTPRVGRFSHGIEQLAGSSSRERVGRFSSGVERWPDASDRLPPGSFADGHDQIPRR